MDVERDPPSIPGLAIFSRGQIKAGSRTPYRVEPSTTFNDGQIR